MSKCNYCENKELLAMAKQTNQVVTYEKGMMGGKDVYVHPKEVVIHNMAKKKKRLYFRCWFMRLGKTCEC